MAARSNTTPIRSLLLISPMVGALTLSLGLSGCRPAPFAVATIVSYHPTKPAGSRCYHRCQADWHHCAASCGGGSTSIVIGLGPVAFGQTRSPAGCRHHCRHARTDCWRGCDGLEERVTRVRVCPDGPARCEELDPNSPTLRLPLYCEGPEGQLTPCGPEAPPPAETPQVKAGESRR